MRRALLLGFALALVLLASGCGGSSTYSLPKTKTCLVARGARTGPIKGDFVASTADGGSFLANLGDNSVKVVFGSTQSDAQQIQQAYERFAGKNVQSGLTSVLYSYKNVVTLWHETPQDSDLALVVGCLK